MKFEIGCKLKVIANTMHHGFEIGEIITIDYFSKTDGCYRASNEDDWWWIREDEIEKL